MSNKLITITGPSCAGKSTLEQRLVDTYGVQKVVSFTTRTKRTGETEGKDYYFVTRESVVSGVKPVAEGTEYNGNLYGIFEEELLGKLSKGHTAAVVEPHGLSQLSNFCKKNHVEHIAIYLTNTPVVLMGRLFKRFRDDVNGLPLDYSSRSISILYKELNWVSEFPYTAAFTFFDSSNETQVVQYIGKLLS